MLFTNKRTIKTPTLGSFTAFEMQEKSVVNWFEFANSLKEITLQLKRSEVLTYDELGQQLSDESLFRLEHYKSTPLPQARYPGG